jgi:hypothetical protein
MEVRLSNMTAAKGISFRRVRWLYLLRCRFIPQPSAMLFGHRWDQKAWTKWYWRQTFGIEYLHLLTVFNQIQTSKGEVIITNDGATILRSIQALHPAAKMVRFCSRLRR